MCVGLTRTPDLGHQIIKIREASTLDEAQSILDSILVTTKLMRTQGIIENIVSSHRDIVMLWIEERNSYHWFERAGFFWYGNQLKIPEFKIIAFT